MHIVPIAHPRLRFPAYFPSRFPFFPSRVPLRRQPRPEMINEIFDNETGFCEHQRFFGVVVVGGGGCGFDAYNGRFAERVHGF